MFFVAFLLLSNSGSGLAPYYFGVVHTLSRCHTPVMMTPRLLEEHHCKHCSLHNQTLISRHYQLCACATHKCSHPSNYSSQVGSKCSTMNKKSCAQTCTRNNTRRPFADRKTDKLFARLRIPKPCKCTTYFRQHGTTDSISKLGCWILCHCGGGWWV